MGFWQGAYVWKTTLCWEENKMMVWCKYIWCSWRAQSPSPHPRALPGSLSWGAVGVPTGVACLLPSQLSPEALPGRSLFGHVGRNRSDFPLMVSISLVQFRDGFPFISLLFPTSLIVSGCQKGRKPWSRGRVYIVCVTKLILVSFP